MNCYLCEESPSPGGTRLHNITADGICQGCGIGVCRRHGHRATEPDLALLCPDCRDRAQRTASAPGTVMRSA